MSVKKQKKGYAGFTLIECVVSLIVIALVCLSFGSLIRTAKSISDSNRLSSELEWHLFLTQFENQTAKWEYMYIKGNKVYFKDVAGKDTKIFEHYKKVIKMDAGYVPFLMNVESMQFEEDEDCVRLKVELTGGDRYEANFFTWKKKTKGL